MIKKDKSKTESYQDTSKGLETEVSLLHRQVRELQLNARQNEDDIKNLYGHIRELRQVNRELREYLRITKICS
jgi:uncharacterized coiled-coil DUF342 family protein